MRNRLCLYLLTTRACTLRCPDEPFSRHDNALLEQQQEILDILSIHAQQGGFSVIIGEPGVGKTVLREHIEGFNAQKDKLVVSLSRTLHTYLNILKQLAESFQIEAPSHALEAALIKVAYQQVRDGKTLYTLIDEAHLLEMTTLRKLRLLFDRFPKKNNLVLFGQADLMYYLSMRTHQDIRSRVTYSQVLYPLNDQDLEAFIDRELAAVKLGVNTFNDSAIELIIRSAQGNLRLCRNLCYGSLVDACRQNERTVLMKHVNAVLVQPHWRSHEEVVTQKAKVKET